MKQLVQNQRSFFKNNTTKNISFRKDSLKRFKTVLKQNESRLFDAISTDFGKSLFVANAPLPRANPILQRDPPFYSLQFLERTD